MIDWRRKQQARADVLLTIETILDAKLPEVMHRNFMNRNALLSSSIYTIHIMGLERVFIRLPLEKEKVL